jgi:hypothetical protein
MATRSNINVKVNDKYHSVYCHNDGYPEGVGETLVNHYNSQELAERLVSFGDMSTLDVSCETEEGHSFDTPAVGRTVYYGRDRGEEWTEKRITDTPRYDEEYMYVWDGTEWYVTGSGIDNKLLKNIVGFEEVLSDYENSDEETTVFKYFGCGIDEVIEINNEWSVTFNTDDPRMTDAYNERQRWAVRHREAPYQGVDEEGIWHHTFFGRTLYEAVDRAKEYLQRGKEYESNRHRMSDEE